MVRKKTERMKEKIETMITKKSDHGKTLYSTDGGKSWSEEIPDGFEFPEIEDIIDSLPEREEQDQKNAESTAI